MSNTLKLRHRNDFLRKVLFTGMYATLKPSEWASTDKASLGSDWGKQNQIRMIKLLEELPTAQNKSCSLVPHADATQSGFDVTSLKYEPLLPCVYVTS